LAKPGVYDRDAQGYAVLAMAQHQLGEENQARVALAKGIDTIDTKLPKLDSSDIGPSWNDWIIARVLIREAKGLIEGGSGTKAQTK
jgi:hypothetical protein